MYALKFHCHMDFSENIEHPLDSFWIQYAIKVQEHLFYLV